MHISTVFSDVYSATKSIYQAEANYFQVERKLAQRLADSTGLKLTETIDRKTVQQRLEPIQTAPNIENIRRERDRNDENRHAFLRQYGEDFKRATEHFSEAIDNYQPEFDVNDKTLQNSLDIARIGKSLSEESVRALLLPLRNNRANFSLVRSALIQGNVNPSFIKDIYAYDGEGLQESYDFLLDEVRSEATERVFSKLVELEQTIITDAKVFGVSLTPFIDEQTKEKAIQMSTYYFMGLSGSSLIDVLRAL